MMEQDKSVTLTITREKGKTQANLKGKGKIPPQTDIKKEAKYYFCRKNGHMKKYWVKFKKWLENKGNPISLLIYKIISLILQCMFTLTLNDVILTKTSL